MTTGAADVVLVMKRPGNIRVIQQALSALGISCVAASDETALLSLFDAPAAPKAALVDMSDFSPRTESVSEVLRGRKIPFIALSAPLGREHHAQPFPGAFNCIPKPVNKRQLQQLTRQLIATKVPA